MSKRLDYGRRLAVGLPVAFFFAVAAPVSICTALAQDQGSWSAASTMPTGTGRFRCRGFRRENLCLRRLNFPPAHPSDFFRHGFRHLGFDS